MKRFSTYIVVLFALLMTACGGATSLSLSDFSHERYTPTYATGFALHSNAEGNATLFTVHTPWQGATDATQHLLLLGEKASAPRDFAGVVVRTPVKRVVVLSSSHLALFDAIGEADRIVGVSGIDYITNPSIQARYQQGEVYDVGRDTNLDFERLTALRPDLLLLYGITGENTALTAKLRELAIPYLYVGDYLEQSPLGKAEWLMLAAALCDRMEEGEAHFRALAERYNRLKAATDTLARRPRVMLNTPYQDAWFMPPSESYLVQLIHDAGGEYCYYNPTTKSVAIDLEEAYLHASEAEVWLHVGGYNTLADLLRDCPKFASVPAVQSHQVWNNNRRQTPAGGSDFWESGIVRPDRILSDLRTILHGYKADTTYYYKRLR